MIKALLPFLLALILSPATFAQLDFSNSARPLSPMLQKMDSAVSAGAYERITSILIAQEGKLVFERYYQDRDSSSRHNTRSCTKTMATLLTGIAIDKGFIQSEKDKVYQYLSQQLPVQHPDPRKDAMTLEDFMSMSSVLECNDDDIFSRGHEGRMYIIEDWGQFLVDLPVRSFPFGPKPSELPYGRSFSYCSAQAAAMAEIVQTAVKQDLDQFAKTHLFDPLGISEYTLHYSPMGILNTAGGSEYRSRDFLKLIQMCLNSGKWHDKQIISASWIEKATTPKVQAYNDAEYGYFFWLKDFGQDKKYRAYYMSGNGGNKILAIPELRLSVVITTVNYNNRNAHGYTDELMNAYIVPAMTGN